MLPIIINYITSLPRSLAIAASIARRLHVYSPIRFFNIFVTAHTFIN